METVQIDPSREIRIWRSGPDLHLAEFQADGRGGWVPTNTVTLPSTKRPELSQAIEQAGTAP